ncbi:MAG TPA: hypothetical protein DEO85_13595 [Maritimibacter sp.]|nr:hypothetical protein [Maritimibacter sp.]
MTFFLLSMVLVVATVSVARPALVGQSPVPVTGVTAPHMLAIMAVLIVVALLFGPVSALALLTAHLLHELGLVIAHRLAGHRDVRFRMLPTPLSGPVSGETHDTDLSALFVRLFGTGFSLAPMVAAFALADLTLASKFAPLSPLFGSLALFIGAYNFVALLPVWPLTGGHIVRLLMRPQVPKVSPLPALAFCMSLTALAWSLGSLLLFIVALCMALAYLLQPPMVLDRPALSLRHMVLGIGAYLATLSAFFLGGWWVILLIASSGA